MKTIQLKFESEEQAESTLLDVQVAMRKDLGVLHRRPDMEAMPGWHVDLLVEDDFDENVVAPFQVFPVTPHHGFAL